MKSEGAPKFEKKTSVPSVEQTTSLDEQVEREVAEVVARALADKDHLFPEERVQKGHEESFFHRAMNKLDKTMMRAEKKWLRDPKEDLEIEAGNKKLNEEVEEYRPHSALLSYARNGEISKEVYNKAYKVLEARRLAKSKFEEAKKEE